MTKDRAWIYNGWSRNGHHSNDWVAKTKLSVLDIHGCLQRIGATSNGRECLIYSQHGRIFVL
jgi:hypothetical protein